MKQVSAVTFSDFNGSNGMSSVVLLKEQGVSIIRIDIPWNDIEKTKGVYTFTKYDDEILAARKAGFDVLPVLAYVPEWNKRIKGQIGSPPSDYSAWRDFVGATVKRYRATPYNIDFFQIWNEPTMKAKFWLGDNIDFITNVYIPAAKIVRGYNGKVVFGGWPQSNSLDEFDHILDKLGAIQYTDIIDFHYRDYKSYIRFYDKYIKTNKAEGIWQTELGYSSKPQYLLSTYLGIMNWALNHNWVSADMYKVFWYPAWGSREKNLYGLATTLKDRTETLTENGKELTLLNQIYGAGALLSQKIRSNVEIDPEANDYIFGVMVGGKDVVIANSLSNNSQKTWQYEFSTDRKPKSVTMILVNGDKHPLSYSYSNGTLQVFVDENDIHNFLGNLKRKIFFIKVS
ncbi:glycoside hydrolase family 39 [Klebsiella sp. I138]|uniref:glycoside hydrolase family 39 n=1 Tax=Klebsiella sp. I138 TaxID=2755385 RepID=UPI003DA7EFB9